MLQINCNKRPEQILNSKADNLSLNKNLRENILLSFMGIVILERNEKEFFLDGECRGWQASRLEAI